MLRLFNKKISKKTKLGKHVQISKDCYILQKNNIGDYCKIFSCAHIQNSKIGKNVKIENSRIDNSEVGDNSQIGPYSNIRPNCKIGKNCRIGNFVEIKNSIIGENTKVSHLAYVGDAEIGKNCNIGCGVVFANYDGKKKNKTKIGNNCFIGSNCTLIAPISIDDNCFICAGSVVTDSVPENTFVIARQVQTNKPNLAKKYLRGKEK